MSGHKSAHRRIEGVTLTRPKATVGVAHVLDKPFAGWDPATGRRRRQDTDTHAVRLLLGPHIGTSNDPVFPGDIKLPCRFTLGISKQKGEKFHRNFKKARVHNRLR